ncbi:MAG: B12-binding domain-containing radical SAM protein, partial [Candidatus Omnitrophota bacterium]
MQEDILSRVYKPGRYLGNEWGVVKKDLRAVALRFALCFPEVYELGMSHLGYRIIYHLLNSQDDIACERAFAPGNDLDEILRARGLPLTSLESDLPLNEFDVLGFSLVYELSFLNCLNILDLCAIPLKTRQRNETHPLVIAGGYACVNPEPMAEFFDCFLVGEGEELVVEVAREIKCALKAK